MHLRLFEPRSVANCDTDILFIDSDFKPTPAAVEAGAATAAPGI